MYLYITKNLNKKSKDYIIYTTVLLIVYNWDLWIHNAEGHFFPAECVNFLNYH